MLLKLFQNFEEERTLQNLLNKASIILISKSNRYPQNGKLQVDITDNIDVNHIHNNLQHNINNLNSTTHQKYQIP